MCRNIKLLFNFKPPVTDEEINAAALQFVRKVSGFHRPSLANEAVFNAAVSRVAAASRSLLKSLETQKTDVEDAQWIHTLHSYGLLKGPFRLQGDLVALRTLLRHRSQLLEHRGHISCTFKKHYCK